MAKSLVNIPQTVHPLPQDFEVSAANKVPPAMANALSNINYIVPSNNLAILFLTPDGQK